MSRVIKNDKFKGMVISFVAHTVFFVGGAFAFNQPAQYAIELGAGGIEIDLVAAPHYPEESNVPVPQEAPVESDEEVVEDAEEARPLPHKPAVIEPTYKGDGSSLVPGKDATTFSSAGGAFMAEAKPGYLRNPAPYYPTASRQRGEEGLVVLWANVDAQGRPDKVELKKSSGYDLLDRSSMDAVKKWKFKPARIGSMAVESVVEIPIRFELDQEKK